jgi:RimJ/RimL family protein N-acetyltransferase
MKLQDYMDKKPVLETGQLILRPLQVSDVADLKEWMGAPSLYQYWGKRPGKGDLNPELLFQKKEKPTKSFHWGIVHKKDDKVVGEMWVYLIESGIPPVPGLSGKRPYGRGAGKSGGLLF